MSAPLLTETRERFLIAILAQVPADRVAEIHFFSPIKQGGVESGVAVVVERGPEPGALEEGQVELLPQPEHERYVVHTARYRLTLKGLDRGKWETSIAAEADAPLATVDAVVRGVQRRSGDVDDATRMDASEVQAFAEHRAATPAAGAAASTATT